MEVLFRFQCTCCGRERLTDSVISKCCNQLMSNVGHVIMTYEEIRSMTT